MTGLLIIYNRGDDDVVIRTNGVLTAKIIDPATREVVGTFAGAQSLPQVLSGLVLRGGPLPLTIR